MSLSPQLTNHLVGGGGPRQPLERAFRQDGSGDQRPQPRQRRRPMGRAAKERSEAPPVLVFVNHRQRRPPGPEPAVEDREPARGHPADGPVELPR